MKEQAHIFLDSCLEFLPLLPSMMDCDLEMSDEIKPFLAKLPMVRMFHKSNKIKIEIWAINV